MPSPRAARILAAADAGTRLTTIANRERVSVARVRGILRDNGRPVPADNGRITRPAATSCTPAAAA